MRGTVIAEENKPEGDAASRHQYALPGQRALVADPVIKYLTDDQKRDLLKQMRAEMLEAAENLDFERAAEIRDSIVQMEGVLKG